VSDRAQNGPGQRQDACANVTASFALQADSVQDVAGAAAELIRRLQEMANLPQCAYELDVDVQWPDAADRALARGGLPASGSPSELR
jgi:hypothetical protein